MRIEYDPSRRPLIAISDAHLFPEPVPHPGREKLLAFLAGLADIPAGRLWIAGDLFDFWFEYGGSRPRDTRGSWSPCACSPPPGGT